MFPASGSARRSILPFDVKGKVSSTTNDEGIIYSGNFVFSLLRSSLMLGLG
jgi:hypothetical protein